MTMKEKNNVNEREEQRRRWGGAQEKNWDDEV